MPKATPTEAQQYRKILPCLESYPELSAQGPPSDIAASHQSMGFPGNQMGVLDRTTRGEVMPIYYPLATGAMQKKRKRDFCNQSTYQSNSIPKERHQFKRQKGNNPRRLLPKLQVITCPTTLDFLSDLNNRLEKSPTRSTYSYKSENCSPSEHRNYTPFAHSPQSSSTMQPYSFHPQQCEPMPHILGAREYIHYVVSLRANTGDPTRYPSPVYVDMEDEDLCALQLQSVEDAILLDGASEEIENLYYSQFAKDEF